MHKTARTGSVLVLAGLVLLSAACQQLDLHTRDPSDMKRVGDMRFSEGRYGLAVREYELYLAENPTNPEVRHQLALSLLELGRYTEAREHALIAHSQALSDPAIFQTACEALYRSRDADLLYEMLRTRAINTGDPAHFVRLAEYAREFEDMDTAERSLLAAAKLDEGRSADIQIGIARFYADIDDKQQAGERLAMAYYLDPTDPRIEPLAERIGVILGPTFARPPLELRSAESLNRAEVTSAPTD